MKSKKLLYFLMACSCASVVAGAAACNKETATVEQGTEYGIYYCAAEDGQYTVSLDGYGKITVYDSADGSEMGSYTVQEDGALKITLQGEDATEELTATLGEGTLVLTKEDGTSYVYYRQVSYRVEFEANGGSNVTSEYVTNGMTASKPADPTRTGYVFLGWYSDEALTTPFDFEDTQITAAVKLYARWAEKAEGTEEFEIKFDLNYEGAESLASMTTIGGKLYDVVTPTRDGYTFRGWWVSAAPDGEEVELSQRYTADMVFDANLTLYADWEAVTTGGKLSKPIITVTENNISWNNVGATSYKWTVTDEDGTVVKSDSTGSTSVDYSFTSLDGGKYKVSVTAVATNTANSADESVVYYVHKALTKVSKFTVVDGALIFNGVENAERYLITVECGDPAHNHTDFDNGNSTYYNFSNCPMQKGGIKFTVKAVADGYATSVSDTFVYNKELDAVTELEYDSTTQTVGWKSVDYAASYILTVKVDGETVIDGADIGNVTSYSLKYYSGDIEVAVYAKTKGYNSADATTTTFTKTGLTAPENVAVANKTVTWTAVEGATSYVVTVAGTEYTAETNSFDLTSILTGLNTGSYSVTVKAVSASDESMVSDAATFTNNGLEGTVKYRDGKVSWESVVGASRYEVRVNSSAKAASYASDVSSATVTFTKSGENTVEVRYYDGSYWSDWVAVTVTAYAIEFDSCGGTSVATIYKAVGDEITMPEAPTYSGYDFAGWYTARGGAESNGAIYDETAMTEAGNKMLFAYWTPKSYTITLVAGDGNTLDVTTVEVTFGKSFEIPVPTAGSGEEVFGGWYTEPDGVTGVTGIQYTDELGDSTRNWDMPSDITLYAHYNSLLSFTKLADDTYSVSKNSAVSSKYFTGTLTIPSTYNGAEVTFVDSSAFASLTYLTKIRLPETVTYIADSAFKSCTSLTDVEIYDVEGVKEPVYSSENGIVVKKTDSNEYELFFIPTAKTGVLELPGNVTYIGTKKIYSLKVSKVVIPTSVTQIEEQAIYSCSGLKDVVFTAGGTDELKIVELGSTRTGIIYSCSAMETIIFPARLKTFTADMLVNCTTLLSIEFENSSDANYKTIDGILYSKDGSEAIYCPRSREGAITFGATVTKIGEKAFYKCAKITEVTFDGMLQEIGESAFDSCYQGTTTTPTGGLKKITFSAATNSAVELAIGDRAFYKCYNLSEIVFAEDSKVTSIGDLAFYYCTALTEFVVPASVKTIGDYAFSYTRFEKVTFAENSTLETIGEGAFARVVETITTTTDGSGNKTSVYKYTYYSSSVSGSTKYGGQYTKITLPASLKTIGVKAFYGLIYLTSVNFEKSTTKLEICDSAFYGCTGLVTFNIPSNVTTIGQDVFGGCKNLEKLTVNGKENSESTDSAYFATADGVLFSADMTELLCYPAAKVGSFTIPETVTKIGANLFANNNAITSVTIGKQVTYIGYGAFYNCDALTEVIFEAGDENSKALTLADGSDTTGMYGIFQNCDNLKKVVLSNRVTRIPVKMFYYCDGVEEFTMSETVTDIAAYAFYYFGCTDELVIPNTIKYIGTYAFYGSEFSKVTFAEGGTDKVTMADTVDRTTGNAIEEPTDAWYTFYYMENLTSVTLPDTLTNIGTYMFASCSKLTSITIPASVTEIGVAPFYNCKALTEVIFEDSDDADATLTIAPGVYATRYSRTSTSQTRSYAGTFSGCTSLTSVTLPKRLTKVPAYMFYSLTSLESVKIPATITNGDVVYATDIWGNENLSATAITMADAGYAIGYYAFYRCTNLSSVEFYGTAKGTEKLTISYGAFYNCKSLTEISLPSTLSDGTGAYYYTGKLTTFDTTAFGAYTDSGSTYYYNPFGGCTSLEKINVAASNKETDYYYSDDQGLLYYKGTDDDGNEFVSLEMCPMGKTGKVTVPKEVTLVGTRLTLTWVSASYSVTSFAGCTKITEVEFEEGGTEDLTIDGIYFSTTKYFISAFSGCSSLTKVSLPSRLTYIGKVTFANLTNLTTVTFGTDCKLKEIGDYAFYNTGLTAIDIPAATTTFGEDVFYNSMLQTVTINTQLTGLSSLLNGCDYIETINVNTDTVTVEDGVLYTNVVDETTKEVTGRCLIYYPMGKTDTSFEVPADVVEIAAYAFQGTTKLKNVTFAERTKDLTIDSYAFSASGITSIVLPAKLSTLGAAAFIRCSSLNSVTFESGCAITAIGSGTFWGCSSLAEIAIPENVTSIGAGAFGLCESLVAVTFSGSNPVIFTAGASYSDDASKDPVDTAYGVFQYCTSLKTIDFNNKVTEIPAYTFYMAESLQTVSNLKPTAIGIYAFNGCASLSAIDLSAYTDTVISGYAFADCVSLEEVTIPSTVTTIGYRAFSGCSSLKTVNNNLSGVTVLGLYAFNKCTSLEMEIDVSSVTSSLSSATGSATTGTFGGYVFQDTKVYGDIEINASIKTLGAGLFSNTNITSVTFNGTTALTISGGAYTASTGVCNGAFSGSKITSVDFGSKTSIAIGAYTFYNCDELLSVSLPTNIKTLSKYSFAECDKLASVEIPTGATLTTIYQGAFMNCSALTSVTFTGTGTKLATIQVSAFEGIGAADIVIPGSVTAVQGRAFANSQIKSLSFAVATNTGTAEKYNLKLGYGYLKSGSTSISSSSYGASEEYGAFTGCTNLSSIDFGGDGVSTGRKVFVAAYTFAGCTALKSLDLTSYVCGGKTTSSSNKVFGYEENAFYGCTNIEEVAICTTNAKVTGIPAYMFRNCTVLKTVNFYADDGETQTLTSIGSSAFEGTGITAIEIPASVTTMYNNVFNNCASLASVTFELNADGKSSLLWLGSSYGYYDDSHGLVFGNCPKLTSITLPETTGSLHVADKAFMNSGLTSVTLSDTVDVVGCGAFEGCANLTTVNLGNGVTAIYSYAFKDCTSLASITLPSQLENINAYAFMNCTALTTIQIPAITELGVAPFYGCTNLTTIDYSLKEGYTTEDNAIYQTIENDDGTTEKILVSVLPNASTTFMVSANVTKIGSGAFAGTAIEEIVISGTDVEIESYAFADMASLKSITLPSGLTSIPNYAFRNCTSLTTVTIPSTVTSIGNGAFYNCTNLATVSISDGVESIGNYAFYGCEKLTSITMPSTLESVGTAAFAGSGITSVSFSAALTEIGDYAFDSCKSLTDVTFAEGTTLTSFGSQVFAESGITSITLPMGVTVMDDYMFYGCTALTSLNFLDSVTSIGSYVLYDTQVADFTIQKTVTAIGKAAFVGSNLVNVVFEDNDDTTDGTVIKWWNTTSVNYSSTSYLERSPFANITTLKTVTLARMETLPSYMFYGCTALESITFADSVTCTYLPYYMCSGAPITSLTIPGTVTTIYPYAFFGSQMTTLTIPDTVTTLYYSAFACNDKLTTLVFEDGSTTIEFKTGASGSYDKEAKIYGTFDNCTSLANVTLSSRVTALGTRAFAYTAITEITLPDTLTSIGTYTFAGSPLAKINIPEGLTSLGSAVFAYTQFTSFEIPDTVATCNGSVFYGCEKLESVKLSNSVTYMSSDMFYGCTSLKSITIPKSYTYLGANAFDGCTSLSSVTFEGSSIKLYSRTFAGCTSIRTLTLPKVVTFNNSSVTEVFDGWTSAQTIEFPGYKSESASWPAGWATGCSAKIKYTA